MRASKCLKAKIDYRLRYYLIGVVLGCLILVILPKPFNISRSTIGDSKSSLHGYYPFTYNDGYNRLINVPGPPQRIVSLAPSITEILYAINASEYLVANTRDCKYPQKARKLPKVGDSKQPDIDVILQYKPDLVLGTLYNSQAQYNQMAELGLVAIAMKQTHLEVIMHDMLMIGKITGKPNAALQLVTKIQNKRESIFEKISALNKIEPVRVIFLSDLEQLVLVRGNEWFREFIILCQATNMADEISIQSSQLPLEIIAETDPELIILAVSSEASTLSGERVNYDILADHPVWKNVAAVREHRIVTMDKKLLFSSGSRIVDAMDAIMRALHPEIPGSL